jgi:hypothetical protein
MTFKTFTIIGKTKTNTNIKMKAHLKSGVLFFVGTSIARPQNCVCVKIHIVGANFVRPLLIILNGVSHGGRIISAPTKCYCNES